MLEKIGLPPKPSQRGNNWVVDATHCQGCASQFTFINRKHHCRRCGGLFCGTCTQQRMALRGQGDSPVRICDPCKKLEEAARFELRHGHKNRTAKGASSKSSLRDEDEVLNQILGSSSSASSLSARDSRSMDHGGEISRSYSVDGGNHVNQEMMVESTTPEELRKRAVEEKGKYKILKAEGKSEEALKAFKRGKELERQADALELTIRKNRRKAMSSVSAAGDSGRKGGNLLDQATKEKDDFLAELREIGLSDVDLQEKDKKSANLSLEGELFSLLGDVSQRNGKEKGTSGIDKSQVLAHKKRALMLKREGKLDEAKQELKKAKILEKELEEQELLGGAAEDSDDEIAALIRGMDGGKNDNDLLSSYDQPGMGFNFNHLSDDVGFGNNVEVTDDDLVDPEMDAALRSLGWTGDSDAVEVSVDKEAMSRELLSLKKEALNLKRAGNTAEAMAQLKKAKLLEKNLESLDAEPAVLPKSSTSQLRNLSKDVSPAKTRMTIQKELLSLKKKALSLRREGKLDEAEEELRKGKILEKQLEEMDSAAKVSSTTVVVNLDVGYGDSDILRNSHDADVDVTEEDLSNPTYLSLLNDLGLKDESSVSSVTQVRSNVPPTRTSTKTRGELQRELLGLKRKALTLRREGKPDEADEVLRSAKELEIQIADMDQPKKEARVESDLKEDGEEVTEKDMHDPALLSILNSLGWKDETEPAVAQVKPSVQVSASSVHLDSLSVTASTSSISQKARRSQGEIQRELLGVKRKALALRRKGETEEAEELLKMASVLEAELEELEESRPIESGTPESLIDRNENVKIPVNTTETTCLMAAGPKDAVVVSLMEEVGVAGSSRAMDQVSSSRNDQATDRSKDHSHVSNSHPSLASQEEESSVQQQVLARKRKALALKREGKLAEAREELRQAKLLEKEILPSPETRAQDESPPAKKKEPVESSSNVVDPPKQQLSGRDRFKLQQESLSHKRQALKLRREGRTQEAEAEFELAKALEAQLEASQESHKPELPGDDVGVDDFLDPQLLAALRAIGVEGPNSTSSQQPQTVRVSPTKPGGETDVVGVGLEERSELEERIKAEKVKAVNLKRAGKQAEAVDALRRAKLYEKRLSSLPAN